MSYHVKKICEELGLRLRDARKMRRLTSKDVARKTGVSERTYRRIEAGEESVGLGQYVKAYGLLDINFMKALNDIEQQRKGRVKKKILINKEDVNF